ncbi:MAG: DUF5320 domain-containing protein [candidate division Zixibacteria bacterium]|nr:DUF5320 domain-containing protein [candidate division Zixibacteria bacterium]
MPGGDKTGPRGEGAMTGRGMGACVGNSTPGFMNPGINPRSRGGFGYGRDMARGNRRGLNAGGQPGSVRGRGRDNMSFAPTPNMDSPQKMNEREELRYLEDEVKRLNKILEGVKSKLDKLSKTKD